SDAVETLAKPGKRTQRIAVPAAQIVKVGAIVPGVRGEFEQFEFVAQLPCPFVQLVGLVEFVHHRERVGQIVVSLSQGSLIAELLEDQGGRSVILRAMGVIAQMMMKNAEIRKEPCP